MRYLWVDQTRLIAAFAVISIHAFSSLYHSFDTAASSDWWFANFVVTFGKSIANPIYAMLSGYLLLGRDIQAVPFIKTHMSRFAPALVFWSIFYAGFSMIFFEATFKDFIWQVSLGFLLTGKAYFHLWYLSTFIIMLLFAPFINQWIKGKVPTRNDIFILFSIVAGLFFMNSLSGLKGEFTESGFNWYTGFAWYLAYFILGYFIGQEKITQRIPAGWLIGVFIFTFLICFIGNYLAASQGVVKDNLVVSNTGIFGFVLAVCAFSLFSKLSSGRVSSPGFQTIAATAFGIYLIHPAVLYFAQKISQSLISHRIPQTLVAVLVTYIVCILIVYVFRKTAIGRRLT